MVWEDGSYRIAICVFLGVNACAGCSIGCHSLILICPKVKGLHLLVVMHTLDYLRPNKRTFCHYAFERDHMVEM